MFRFAIPIAAVVFVASPALAFDSFAGETTALADLIKCPTPKLTQDDGLPDMWSCTLPNAEVVKVFINEDGDEGVEDVKVMWNDWTRETGYGVHTDKAMAEAWVAAIATRYAPTSVDQVLDAFRGNADTAIAGDGHVLEYSYFKGPAIDERLITITASETAASPDVVVQTSPLAGSAGLSMICKNPGREYFLVYQPGAGAIIINPDSDNGAWNILSTLVDDSQHVVIVSLGAPGMTAQVHFRPYRKVDIFDDGELAQTDGCRS